MQGLQTARLRAAGSGGRTPEPQRGGTNQAQGSALGQVGVRWGAPKGRPNDGDVGRYPTTSYIARQQEHHKRASFQDEFLAFLRRHDIPFDERYVWD
jgi:hypothetical protein